MKNELIGLELTCSELDYKMQQYDYYSEFDVYDNELLESGCIIYLSKKDNESQTRIEFDVTIKNSDDEIEQATYIKIKDIDL